MVERLFYKLLMCKPYVKRYERKRHIIDFIAGMTANFEVKEKNW